MPLKKIKVPKHDKEKNRVVVMFANNSMFLDIRKAHAFVLLLHISESVY